MAEEPNLLVHQENGNDSAIEAGDLNVECGNSAHAEKDVLKYFDRGTNFEEVGVIKFLNPLNSECNYFEYEILATGVECAIGIGIGGRDYPLNQMPGWCRNGIGYHADDGCIFNEGVAKMSFHTCTKSDKMGCGVEFSEEDTEFVNVFFTKNGQQIGDVTKLKKTASGLYSVVGMLGSGTQVRYLGHSQHNLPINLFQAIEEESISKVEEWISQHADQSDDKIKREVSKAFHSACSRGLTDIIESLLKKYENDFKLIESCESDQEHVTALHVAARNDLPEVISLLLKCKTDAHLLRDNQSYTPLMIAAASGHVKPFEILLNHSANYHPEEEIQAPEPKKGRLRNWVSKQRQRKKTPGNELEDHNKELLAEKVNDGDSVDGSGGEVIANIRHSDDEQDIESAGQQLQSDPVHHKEQEEIEMKQQIAVTIEDHGNGSEENIEAESIHQAMEEAGIKLDTAITVPKSLDTNVSEVVDDSNTEAESAFNLDSEFEVNLKGQERISKSTMDLTDSADATEIFLNQNRDMFAMLDSTRGPFAVSAMIREKLTRKLVYSEWNQKNIMHLAAEKGHIEIVKKLWEHSKTAYIVLLTRKDDSGNTPLHLACKEGKKEILEEFFEVMKNAEVPDIVSRFNIPNWDKNDVCAILIQMTNNDDNSPAHLACLHGHEAIVITLIKSLKIRIIEFKNKDKQTLMHLAATGGHVEVLKILTKEHAKINVRDQNRETPLHLAARNGHKAAVEHLMSHLASDKEGREQGWFANYESTFLDVAIRKGHREIVEVILKGTEPKEWKNDQIFSKKTLMLLVEKMPDVAEYVLNKCIKPTNWNYGSADCKVDFEFDLLKGRSGASRNKLLRSLSAHKHKELIKHPLVQSIIDAIWRKYKYLFYFSLLLHIFFVVMLTSLALLIKNPTSQICQSVRSGQFDSSGSELSFNISDIQEQGDVMAFLMDENITIIDDVANISSQTICFNDTVRDALAMVASVDIACGECEINSRDMVFIMVAAMIIIVISGIRLILETYQVIKSLVKPYQHRLEYFVDLANWLEVPVYLCAIIFASAQLSSVCTCVQDSIWNVGTFGVFFAWTSLVIYMRKLEFLDTGIYVLMFEILLKRFIKVIILSGLLVMTFSLTFYMAFNQLDPLFRASPFASPLNSIWKTMTMMTGELDYESIFRQASGGSDTEVPGLPFPETAYILWFLFLILMPVLLSNLLVGLAVDDIKGILETAELTRIESKIDLIISLDNFRVIIVVLCCLPCIFSDCCYDCVGSVYESLDVDNQSVYPFKKRHYYWFQQEKKYKSPKLLCGIIEPPNKENLMEEMLQKHIENMQEAVNQLMHEKMEAMKTSVDELMQEFQGSIKS